MPEPEIKVPKLTVAIQAGGQSSRMGTDKSFVPYRGRPMIEAVVAAVKDLGRETIVITNHPEPYGYLDLPLFGDIYANRGPLGGIFTALASANNPHILIVACDMPLLNRRLLGQMIALRESADVIIPRWDKFPEPLHAVYSKTCILPIEKRIKADQLKITGFFQDVSVRFLEREEIALYDPQGLSFTNVNTPDELQQVH